MGGRSSSFGKSAGGGLAMLKGSEKQVKWAGEIRDKMKDKLAEDGKLVDKYLRMADDPNADPKELARLQYKLDNFGIYSNNASLKVSPVSGDDISDEQAFNDARSNIIDYYRDYHYSTKEEAQRDMAKVKSDYLSSGGKKAWNLGEKYYKASDSQADKAYNKWQTEAEKTRLKYVRKRWSDKLSSEKSSSWFINNRMLY